VAHAGALDPLEIADRLFGAGQEFMEGFGKTVFYGWTLYGLG
jgi:hypothetical protein